MPGIGEDIEGLIFDLDGVLTDTATLHFRAWKRVFDDFLRGREGEGFDAFTDADYRRWVDGKPRYEGAASFLESRNISLPRGDPDDPPDAHTVRGLAGRKNEHFHELLREHGVTPFPDALAFLRDARGRGLRSGIVTSSRNGREVVRAAEGLGELVETCVDGTDLDAGLQGKPAPDLFLEAARRLELAPDAGAVFEDARSGVEAGRAGGFALVVGVARDGGEEALRAAGADLVVARLDEIELNEDGGREERRP